MKKILITGSSGFLGWHIANQLEGKYELYGLDLHPSKFKFKEFYQQDINRLFTLPNEFDSVIHLAALTNSKESYEMPIMYFITNINGTMNILNKVKTKNFIYPTLKNKTETNPYSLSKTAASYVIQEYCLKHNPQSYSILELDLSSDIEDYIHSIVCDAFKVAIENPFNGVKQID